MNAVDLMRSPPFSKATFSTLIGLIAVTGMRMGEVIALDRDDFAPRKGLITIRKGKFGKSRELVLHQSAQDALCSYECNPASTAPSSLSGSAMSPWRQRRCIYTPT